jgi:hypothetical protein
LFLFLAPFLSWTFLDSPCYQRKSF